MIQAGMFIQNSIGTRAFIGDICMVQMANGAWFKGKIIGISASGVQFHDRYLPYINIVDFKIGSRSTKTVQRRRRKY